MAQRAEKDKNSQPQIAKRRRVSLLASGFIPGEFSLPIKGNATAQDDIREIRVLRIKKFIDLLV